MSPVVSPEKMKQYLDQLGKEAIAYTKSEAKYRMLQMIFDIQKAQNGRVYNVLGALGHNQLKIIIQCIREMLAEIEDLSSLEAWKHKEAKMPEQFEHPVDTETDETEATVPATEMQGETEEEKQDEVLEEAAAPAIEPAETETVETPVEAPAETPLGEQIDSPAEPELPVETQ